MQNTTKVSVGVTVKENKKNMWEFEVTVSDNDGKTTHTVTIDEVYYNKLTDKKEKPEDFVKRSFEFLLERETKESILKKFNIKEINKYFPEFEKAICYYC